MWPQPVMVLLLSKSSRQMGQLLLSCWSPSPAAAATAAAEAPAPLSRAARSSAPDKCLTCSSCRCSNLTQQQALSEVPCQHAAAAIAAAGAPAGQSRQHGHVRAAHCRVALAEQMGKANERHSVCCNRDGNCKAALDIRLSQRTGAAFGSQSVCFQAEHSFIVDSMTERHLDCSVADKEARSHLSTAAPQLTLPLPHIQPQL